MRPLIAGLAWLAMFYVLTYWFAGRRKQGAMTRRTFATTYAAFVAAIPLWLNVVGGLQLSALTVLLASAILFGSTLVSAYLLGPILRLR